MHWPTVVPVMTLANVILFPHAMLPLYVFEPRYRRMLTDALEAHRLFAVAMRKPGSSREMPAGVGGLGLIRAAVTHPDGTSHVVLQGMARVALVERLQTRPYRRYRIEPLPPADTSSLHADALASKVMELVGERLTLGFQGPWRVQAEKVTVSSPSPAEGEIDALQAFREVIKQLADQDYREQLVDLVSATLLSEASDRQTILETRNLEERLQYLVRFLVKEIRRRKRPTNG